MEPSEAAIAAFLRVIADCGTAFKLSDVRRHKRDADYLLARRAGFFADAGIETTVKGDDLLNRKIYE